MTYIAVVPLKPGDPPPRIVVSMDGPEQRDLLEAIPKVGQSFQLSWSGSLQTPKGAVVGEHTIDRITNGNVFDSRGDIIGTYRWLFNDGGGKIILVTVFLEDSDEILEHLAMKAETFG